MTVPASRPYQVCLYVGPSTPTVEGVRVVDLTPAEPTPASVLDKLRASDLTPADLRSRALFVADGDSEYRTATLLAYSALIGFAKRRIDVSFAVDGDSLSMADFDAQLRKIKDAGRPEQVLATAQLGGPARQDLAYVDATAAFTGEVVSIIRYARRLRLVPLHSTAQALQQLVAVAALRARGTVDKLPFLCDGTEPGPSVDTPNEVVGLCLDTVRRNAEELRRSLRSDNREAIADRVEQTTQQRRLTEADAVPVEAVLQRLGARSKIVEVAAKPGTPEAEAGAPTQIEVWHCPRPNRHTNGDANPSSRVTVQHDSALFQCFRCDPERVGSLRLVMDTRGLTAPEAADWILS